MVEADVVGDVKQFGNGAESADNAESGEQDIPADERAAELVTRPVGHPLLDGKDDQDVDAHVVEAAGPVPVEP